MTCGKERRRREVLGEKIVGNARGHTLYTNPISQEIITHLLPSLAYAD
jgi:hypothetical protein